MGVLHVLKEWGDSEKTVSGSWFHYQGTIPGRAIVSSLMNSDGSLKLRLLLQATQYKWEYVIIFLLS